ncbi:MAG: hypothetical protein GF313_12235 [Caldithrix sp.]|nr:hypothetical protein [Caldithrix sp.]
MKKTFYFSIIFFLAAGIRLSAKNSADMSFLIGEVQVMPKTETQWKKAQLDMAVFAGDRIRTRLNSRCELTMPDGSLIKINENTIFDVDEIKRPEEDDEDSMGFTLWAGDVWAKFKKVITSRQKREIESPSAVVAIRGTTLRMNVNEERTTTVQVIEGLVSVRSKDAEGEVQVGANQQSVVAPGRAPTQPASVQPGDDNREDQSMGFRFKVNTSRFQYKDPAVLTGGILLQGQVTADTKVFANQKPLQVTPNGNFRGRVAVREGINTINLQAVKGQRRQEKTVRVLVNTQSPEIRLSKPLVSGFLNRRDYSLSGAVFDPTPADRIKVFINEQLITQVVGRGTFNRTIILNEGQNTINIMAADLSDNRTQINENIFLDTVKPIINITDPPKKVFVRYEPPRPPQNELNNRAERFEQTIRGIIVDPEPSSKIKRVTINGKDVQPKSDGSFETKIVLERKPGALSAAENRLNIYVEDMAGNVTRDNSHTIIIR